MGLRFRRSVKICNGVRVNFGKTGASVSLGGKGYKKTFHTSGKVTTSVGIPGTGIYWTETENMNKAISQKEKGHTHTSSAFTDIDFNCTTNEVSKNDFYEDSVDYDEINIDECSDFDDLEIDDEIINNNQTNIYQEGYTPTIGDIIEDYDMENRIEIDNTDEANTLGNLNDEIRRIYLGQDIPIDWSEILFSNNHEEVLMEKKLWDFCKTKVDGILDGDIDSYLDVIEVIEPLNDLLLYAGDFEFGTDNCTIMEVQYIPVLNNLVLKDDNLFDEYICAISLRVAKDIFSVLPVTKVIVETNLNSNIINRVEIEKNKLLKVDTNKCATAKEIVQLLNQIL